MSKLFYAMYDLANSAYTIIIVTFITSAYFANHIVGNPQIGAAADIKLKGKINLLQIFTILCILSTCLFWFANPYTNYILYTLIIFFLSNYCYEAATIFYNSFLKNCSNENNIGKTSGLGFALGYIGSIPILLFILYVFVLPDTIPFGLDKSKFENIRFIPIIAAVWFLIFSYPMINYFKRYVQFKKNVNHNLLFLKNLFNSYGKINLQPLQNLF